MPARCTSAPELDEEQHVDPAQPHGLDAEEVTRQHLVRLGAQERRPGGPGPARRGTESSPSQDALHRARRDADAEVAQLANDAQIAPPRVLPRNTHHDVAHFFTNGRSTQLGIGPSAPHQLSMPAQQRGGRHHKRGPARPGKQPSQQRQHGPVRRREIRSTHLTTQHLDLMSQDRDLHVLRESRSEPPPKHIHKPTNQQVHEPAQHRATLPARTRDRLMTPFRRNSPTIRRYPHRGFSLASRTTAARTSS